MVVAHNTKNIKSWCSTQKIDIQGDIPLAYTTYLFQWTIWDYAIKPWPICHIVGIVRKMRKVSWRIKFRKGKLNKNNGCLGRNLFVLKAIFKGKTQLSFVVIQGYWVNILHYYYKNLFCWSGIRLQAKYQVATSTVARNLVNILSSSSLTHDILFLLLPFLI